jgi:hypothetical protein
MTTGNWVLFLTNLEKWRFDILPQLKLGDSCSWFADRTYYFKLPIHSRGTYLPKRSPLRGSSPMPLGTVFFDQPNKNLGCCFSR